MSPLNNSLLGALNRATSLNHQLDFARAWLDDPAVTEIAVNRPGQAWCERAGRWEQHPLPALGYDQLQALATAAARFASSEISETQPVLSAILPGGERAQFVVPPACEHGTVSLTIRKPSKQVRQLHDYETEGFFDHLTPQAGHPSADNGALGLLKEQGQILAFLRSAVKQQKNIVVAGETGSGKTTFMKALMQEIPSSERIITVEDVPELFLPTHPNHVHLFYPSEAREEENAPITAASLLKSCMRMKPDRILLAELRGGEAFDFLNLAASGHGGSITSVHAGSPQLAFERLALMVLQNRQGRSLPYPVIRRLLHLVIDVVVHIHNDIEEGQGRHITDIWYDPAQKHAPTPSAWG